MSATAMEWVTTTHLELGTAAHPTLVRWSTWRPGGVHLGEWASALVSYALVPRRAVWMPVGG